MKLLISASSIHKAEIMLNNHFYSTTYQIIDNKVFFKSPLQQNENLSFKLKGSKYQVYSV
jgi:hypothetical protein